MSQPEYLGLIYLHHTAQSEAVQRSLDFFSEQHSEINAELKKLTPLENDDQYDQVRCGLADRMMLPWADRSVHFGDGIYEVSRICNGEYKFFARHMARLSRSFTRMGFIQSPSDILALIEKWALFMLDKSRVQSEAIIYIQVSRCVSEKRGHVPNGKSANFPSVYMQLIPMPKMKDILYQQGTTAHLVSDNRHFVCDIKTVNLLANYMSVKSVAESGDSLAVECVMYRAPYSIDIPLDTPPKELALKGVVTEASASSVVAVIGGEIWTHPESNMVLPSITRRFIIEKAKEAGYIVHEDRFTVDTMIHKASELFLLSTVKGALPIVKCIWIEFGNEEIIIGDGKPGPVAKALHDLWKEV
eukprot:TRINITY_DN9784_c0_g1_i1.p1 TRINITY_DN9784_c0_g1~~TRINITY_DN9784_c0_g1_i1.p1  ORF type:complete len:358 (-),score=120.88 TRINITY_DN9784_c0_g1_i1:18-1091(-)